MNLELKLLRRSSQIFVCLHRHMWSQKHAVSYMTGIVGDPAYPASDHEKEKCNSTVGHPPRCQAKLLRRSLRSFTQQPMWNPCRHLNTGSKNWVWYLDVKEWLLGVTVRWISFSFALTGKDWIRINVSLLYIFFKLYT